MPLPGGVDYNISSLVFDFGFAFDLLILVMCVAGLSDRRDGKLAVVALVLLAAAFLGLVL